MMGEGEEEHVSGLVIDGSLNANVSIQEAFDMIQGNQREIALTIQNILKRLTRVEELVQSLRKKAKNDD